MNTEKLRQAKQKAGEAQRATVLRLKWLIIGAAILFAWSNYSHLLPSIGSFARIASVGDRSENSQVELPPPPVSSLWRSESPTKIERAPKHYGRDGFIRIFKSHHSIQWLSEKHNVSKTLLRSVNGLGANEEPIVGEDVFIPR